ncbi:glutamine amidotransferase [Liquorilactobacillus sucicola DSM 21376 = JCM 15457]|uniref:Peptidase C26 n=1 Tax=Liquorilactobacillus sucicola DSM 21376 = JCM 15457 TaxID=1423806 RepID=A0A023CTU1_9LACO|nr:gamma-glutamyl-gamma-aminobutyrate hydrolase family protein [Liquorilactobacillus sucicola]KRN05115.1 peptidase C26 [Liquorilactobacillus sucicola DSM 21376 = JCM 15457]GAJ25162.1 glutamine amidotransferase [Liquorilactobacillus sucicola DSM 21376 = JCM 15457]
MIPKIGIASNHLIHPTEKFKTNYVDYIQMAYVDGVRQSGGLPIVLPLGQKNEAKAYIETVDALLLAGGQDVAPELYGAKPIEELGETDLARDQFEISLVEEALRANKPILGICRGQQVINVALGGTLYQDIHLQLGVTAQHNQYPTAFEVQTHHITAVQNSWLDNLVGHRLFVNSFHHQAVKKLGHGLHAAAVSDDGVVESIESNNSNIFAVQFHPECLFKKHSDFERIFGHLTEKAAKQKENPSSTLIRSVS